MADVADTTLTRFGSTHYIRPVSAAALPPYGIPPQRFPFRALAARTARGALGGERETALGCLMAARLAASVLEPYRLPAPLRDSRAKAARSWMATLTVPATLRIPLARVVDASAGEDTLRLAHNVRVLALAAAEWLDTPARTELERLALALGDEPPRQSVENSFATP